ncbi:MAG: FliA/WhiG family RNA polymerase sigma factor [Defluviitaleaceae bacterium]|nr:FliA/WhiG family RNA polymerase sigma factor [Defluviitaleaceae bacterium]
MNNGDNLNKLWKTYAQNKDPAIKEQLIVHYAPMIKYVVGRLGMHIGNNADHEDLMSYGIFGLIDAIDKFDFNKGVKFETYASLRIRGAIIDSLRAMDWIPRTLRQKSKQLESVYSDLENKLGREPSDEELAKSLSITVDEAQELIKKSSLMSLISLNEYLEVNHDAAFADNSTEQNPEAMLDRKQMQDMLTQAIEGLRDNERMVVTLYYFEELTLKEISKIMGVTESRISQIHSKSILRLRTRLGKYRSLLVI